MRPSSTYSDSFLSARDALSPPQRSQSRLSLRSTSPMHPRHFASGLRRLSESVVSGGHSHYSMDFASVDDFDEFDLLEGASVLSSDMEEDIDMQSRSALAY